MKIFNLPDLGEGLAEAEIREWYVAEGDTVKTEQPLCSVETAKAVVDVPSPHSGKISKLYGKAGDVIQTGHPLVGFEDQTAASQPDSGTVVGQLETAKTILKESATGVTTSSASGSRIKASPAVRALAKELHVDLENVAATGPHNSISLEDVRKAAKATEAEGESLHSTRRAMALIIAQAHKEVVPVTLVEDVDIHQWKSDKDVTLHIIHSIVKACEAVPTLNSHFDGKALKQKLYKEIHLGIAVDTEAGLFVPVLKNVNSRDDAELRKNINKFKECAQKNSFAPEDLKGATIVLSNFGTIAGRYANPLVIPPTVAIIGIGKKRAEVVAEDGKPVVHNILPLSITVDHRAITGGEAARFLAALIKNLQE